MPNPTYRSSKKLPPNSAEADLSNTTAGIPKGNDQQLSIFDTTPVEDLFLKNREKEALMQVSEQRGRMGTITAAHRFTEDCQQQVSGVIAVYIDAHCKESNRQTEKTRLMKYRRYLEAQGINTLLELSKVCDAAAFRLFMEKYVASLAAQLKPNSCSNYFNSLKRFFSFLSKSYSNEFGDLAEYEFPGISKASKSVYSYEDLEADFKKTSEWLRDNMPLCFEDTPTPRRIHDGDEDKAMLAAFLYTCYYQGARSIQELLSIKRHHLEFRDSGENYISFFCTFEKDFIRMPLHKKAKAALENYLRLKRFRENDFIFPYSSSTIQRRLRRIQLEKKTKYKITPNKLKVVFLQNAMLREGQNRSVVQSQMACSDATFNRYNKRQEIWGVGITEIPEDEF